MQGGIKIHPQHFQNVLHACAQFHVVADRCSVQVVERSHFLPFQFTKERDFVEDKAVEVMVVVGFKVSITGAEAVVVEQLEVAEVAR